MSALNCIMEVSSSSSFFIVVLLLLSSPAPSAAEVTSSPGRRLLTAEKVNASFIKKGCNDSKPHNPRLEQAYIALSAWKRAIISDPTNFTGNWVGHDVCSYNGVFCARALDEPSLDTVAGVDLNGARLAGCLPDELGLLSDIAILHLNSNGFFNAPPKTISNLTLLHELDLSNNRLTGCFPSAILALPSLRYLDLRFNHFEGPLPKELFEKDIDALFLNNNLFSSCLPENFGNLPASAVVLANNHLEGSIPRSIRNMSKTLNEIILANNSFTGCLPEEIESLKAATVFDVSFNSLVGGVTNSFRGLKKLARLNLGHNELTGVVPESVCGLKNLMNLSVGYNYFNGVEEGCKARSGMKFDDCGNCTPGKGGQRPPQECEAVVNKPVCCDRSKRRSASTIALPPTTAPSPAPVGGFRHAPPPASVSKGY